MSEMNPFHKQTAEQAYPVDINSKDRVYKQKTNHDTWTFLAVSTTLSFSSTDDSERFDPGDSNRLLKSQI